MSLKQRSAFTLVELLVVIAIIGTLASLIVPAVMQAQENARRAVCQNNLRSLGEAVATYKNANQGAYPGYNERIGRGINPANSANGVRVPWSVVLLNNLEQASLYKQWRKTADPTQPLPAALRPRLKVYYCPSSENFKGREGPVLSYVLNSGLGRQQGGTEKPANGIGVDRFTRPQLRITDVTLAEDGIGYTMLFSENLQSGNWTDLQIQDIGMLWWQGNPAPVSLINGEKSTASKSMLSARPSSMHYDGVNICFADGRVTFMRENVSYQVYRQLLATVDNKSDMACAPNCPSISADDYE